MAETYTVASRTFRVGQPCRVRTLTMGVVPGRMAEPAMPLTRDLMRVTLLIPAEVRGKAILAWEEVTWAFDPEDVVIDPEGEFA